MRDLDNHAWAPRCLCGPIIIATVIAQDHDKMKLLSYTHMGPLVQPSYDGLAPLNVFDRPSFKWYLSSGFPESRPS